jgi:UDP-N-acetylmuramoyl-tripeptide--D-alanyl-D-alanine ligase
MRYFLLVAFLLFALRRLLTYLHIYQQDEYDSRRFIVWMLTSRSFDLRASLLILVVGVLEKVIYLSPDIGAGLIGAAFLIIAFFERDPRAASKKRLVMTGRATRIYWIAFAVMAIIAVLYTLPGVALLLWLIPAQFIPFSLALANLVLVPYERSVQKRFWNEAHQKLLSLRPTIIGITGSFGKTSTKHLLGHILELQAPTLITPGSVNTPMGIARVVREQLGSHHRFFVCEMGAYGPGSIARLCRLAPPNVGVITAVGMAHYERFKTLDAVAKTKFELADSASSQSGSVIIAEQVLEFAAARAFLEQHPASTTVVGTSGISQARIVRSAQTDSGITADVEWNGRIYTLRAPIYGEHHISNMVLAFVTACLLGAPPEDTILALSSTPQIPHRLEVKAGMGGSRLIDDAYNSNPVGFASGLRLLGTLHTNGGRRILVTPGMVEMGAAHEEEHRKIGQLAASHVDVLLPVLPQRISSLISSYQQARPDGLVIPCSSFSAAQTWLSENIRLGDVVLMENDLPDLYEKKLRL